MATDTLDHPKVKTKFDFKANTAKVPDGLMPGDTVWYWMRPDADRPMQPYPAILVERNRLDSEKWEVAIVKRSIVRGQTAAVSAMPLPGCITVRDQKFLDR